MNAPTSQDLLVLYQEGDQRAASAIFDRYVIRLVALVRKRLSAKLARRVDPEDVVQSAYRSFFAAAQQDRYVLQRAGDLWRLLAAIALNKLQKQVERQTAARRDIHREQPPAPDDSTPPAEPAAPDPSAEEQAAVVEQLELVMQRAAPPQRRILEMRLQGQTIEQIATAVQRSERTVRRLLEKTRIELQRLFSEDSGQ